MSWKNLIPHRHKPPGSVPQLPPPRLICAQAQSELVLPVGQQILEVVGVVPPEKLLLDWTDVLHSLAALGSTPRWADTDVAKEFGRGHWERLWPTFARYSEVSIVFPATETVDVGGFAWVPCVRMSMQGCVLTKTWLRNILTGETMTMTHSDFVALRLA